MTAAMYTGSFDPLTNRHHSLLATAAMLFDRIMVAVAADPPYETMFGVEERLEMVRQCAESISPERITVVGVKRDSLADCAEEYGCGFLLRRMPSSQESEEAELRQGNFGLPRSIRPVYLFPDPEVADTTSALVRSLVGTSGWREAIKVHVWVPVWERLLDKAKKGDLPG